MRRVALIGMNNPLSRKPEHALWPDPPNCTGWRIWKMLEKRTGATKGDYLGAFQRYNLCEGVWHRRDAQWWWQDMEADLLASYDTIVLLGGAVRRATGLVLPDIYISRTVCTIPHPSGLNRWYNDEINRGVVELLLEELYTEAVGA